MDTKTIVYAGCELVVLASLSIYLKNQIEEVRHENSELKKEIEGLKAALTHHGRAISMLLDKNNLNKSPQNRPSQNTPSSESQQQEAVEMDEIDFNEDELDKELSEEYSGLEKEELKSISGDSKVEVLNSDLD